MCLLVDETLKCDALFLDRGEEALLIRGGGCDNEVDAEGGSGR